MHRCMIPLACWEEQPPQNFRGSFGAYPFTDLKDFDFEDVCSKTFKGSAAGGISDDSSGYEFAQFLLPLSLFVSALGSLRAPPPPYTSSQRVVPASPAAKVI